MQEQSRSLIVNVQLESFDLKHRIAAAQNGELILIQLPEDGGICGRFKFSDLDSNEEQNWVARSTRMISIPTGKFAIDAGGFFGKQMEKSTGSGLIASCYAA